MAAPLSSWPRCLRALTAAGCSCSHASAAADAAATLTASADDVEAGVPAGAGAAAHRRCLGAMAGGCAIAAAAPMPPVHATLLSARHHGCAGSLESTPRTPSANPPAGRRSTASCNRRAGAPPAAWLPLRLQWRSNIQDVTMRLGCRHQVSTPADVATGQRSVPPAALHQPRFSTLLLRAALLER
eukprot:363901-Chlamydomonas_euryale.AAC.18